jgi:hypothetical protein
MDIDEYRRGYEAGVDSTPLDAPTDAIDYTIHGEDWRRGYDDAIAGRPFDPGEDDDGEDDDGEED